MTLLDLDEAITVHPAHLSLTAHVKSSLEFTLGNIADNEGLFEKIYGIRVNENNIRIKV